MSLVLRNVPLALGALGLLALAVIAVFGQRLAPLDPNAEQWILIGKLDTPERFRFPPTAPDARHWLGTDGLGRDLFSRFLAGAQLTFAVVGTALAARMGLGTAVGALAGWSRGPAGALARRLIGAATAMPQLLVALALVLLLREHGVVGFALALALVGWGEVGSFVMDRVGALRGASHVEAARALGAGEQRVVRDHVLRMVVPSLLTLSALEAGAVLLLLAELGVLGLFVAGASYYVNEDTRLPILPLRDRAPEWGQMLAGLQAYGNEQRYIVLIPAMVVAGAVFVFNVLGEGLRIATDPHSTLRLPPRAISLTVRGTALALAAAIAITTAGSLVRTDVDLDDALPLARETARRTLPAGELVAAAVRFKAETGALSRPEMVNFYFWDRTHSNLLRVGFVGGDRNTMEVRPHHLDDPIAPWDLAPLDSDVAGWETALTRSQDRGGSSFRQSFPSYEVRLIVTRPSADQPPRYEVLYTSGPTVRRDCCFDVEGKPIPTRRPDDH